MFNWLLMVGTDGRPDTSVPLNISNEVCFFLGTIIGMLVTLLFIVICKLVSNSKNNNDTDTTHNNDSEEERK